MYRQHNGKKNRDKRTITDLQNTTQKTNDRAMQTLLSTGRKRINIPKGVIRIRKLKDRKHNSQQKNKKNEKQMSPKQYTEN